jgi:hypothetical protein
MQVKALAQLGRWADLVDSALVNEGDAIAAFGLIEIMGGDHNRRTLLSNFCQKGPNFSPKNRINAGRDLIQQQNRRIGDQGAAEGQLLSHSSR